MTANCVLRTVPPRRPPIPQETGYLLLGAVPSLSPPPQPFPSFPPTPLTHLTGFMLLQPFLMRASGQASLQLNYVTCCCFWSKDHPGKVVRGGHAARASLIMAPAPSELGGGAGIWTLQELTVPPPPPEPNLQDACSSSFVNFQQAGLSQREPVGCPGYLESCSPDVGSRLLAGTWPYISLTWVGSSSMSGLSTITPLTNDDPLV